MDKKDIKRKLKETPESKVDRLIEMTGLVGIEKDIAYLRCVKHMSVVQICNELCISESTYHRNFNMILIKIDGMLNGNMDVDKLIQI